MTRRCWPHFDIQHRRHWDMNIRTAYRIQHACWLYTTITTSHLDAIGSHKWLYNTTYYTLFAWAVVRNMCTWMSLVSRRCTIAHTYTLAWKAFHRKHDLLYIITCQGRATSTGENTKTEVLSHIAQQTHNALTRQHKQKTRPHSAESLNIIFLTKIPDKARSREHLRYICAKEQMQPPMWLLYGRCGSILWERRKKPTNMTCVRNE